MGDGVDTLQLISSSPSEGVLGDSTTPQTYGPYDYPMNSMSLPPYPPYSPDQTTTSSPQVAVDPQSLVSANSLAATLSNIGLTWFATASGKPIAGSVNQSGQLVNTQVQSRNQTLIILGVVVIAAILLMKK